MACKRISYLETPARKVGLKNPYLICDYYGRSHEAEECSQNNPAEQAGEDEDPNEVKEVSFYPRMETVEPLEWKALKNQLKPSSIEPPEIKFKELPKHLKYAFLQDNNQLPVVISSALSTIEKARLLEVLKNHKAAIT
uniref:DNA-directed DNA polymerase n=1 Tax=Tanacetum cinerariifolium TaxID=118510 RepID=A0A6L2MHC5_TANCI|nr:DNA-directed DNA polymerase [Tanacetum cinerariifolium]